MTLFNKKQMADLMADLNRRGEAVIALDDTTMVRRYGEQPHILLRSQMAGCEGELVINQASFAKLAQLFAELSKGKVEPELDEDSIKA